MSNMMRRTDKRGGAGLEFSDRTRVPSPQVAGGAILRELPDDLASLVYPVYRLVFAFSQRHPRSTWFSAERLRAWEESVLLGAVEPEVRAPMAVLIGELVDPDRADVALVSRCCWCMTEWALDRHEETALAFAELAALSWPTNGRHALILARLYRNSGYPRKGEVWFRRASRLASAAADWEVAVLSTSGLAMLVWDQANFPRAKALLERAQRVAQRHSLRSLEAEVLHNRLAVAITAGDLEAAEDFARAAFERYQPEHHRIPALAYDIAYLWLSKGYAGQALNTFQALLPHFPDGEPRIQVLCAIARAAGMLAREDAFVWSAHEAREATAAVEKSPTRAAALIDLALGAISLDRPREATEALERACNVAGRMNQSDMLIKAEDALARLREGRPEVSFPENPGSEREAFTRRITGVLERLASESLLADPQ
jgi:tetratricopeptide (TPR) repeat protein